MYNADPSMTPRVDDVKHKSLVVTLTRPCTEIPHNSSPLQMSLFYWFTKKASSLKVFLSSFEGSVPCIAESAVVELLHLGGLSHRPDHLCTDVCLPAGLLSFSLSS